MYVNGHNYMQACTMAIYDLSFPSYGKRRQAKLGSVSRETVSQPGKIRRTFPNLVSEATPKLKG